MGGLTGHPDAMEFAARLEGRLDQEALAALERHLAGCARCRRLAEQPVEPTAPLSGAHTAVPAYLRSALGEHGLHLRVFADVQGPLLADVTPALLPAPGMAAFFARARENAAIEGQQTLDVAGLSISLSLDGEGGIALELAGVVDSFWLGIDGWESRSEIPLEPGRQVYRISGLSLSERIETSIVRGGMHCPLLVEVHGYGQAGEDAGLHPALVRAAARALAAGRITAFARIATRLRDRVPALGELAAVMAGWCAMYPALWLRTVLLGRGLVRGDETEENGIDEARLAAVQPWLPFDEELVEQYRDTRRQDELADSAFFNLARQKLCAQVLHYFDEGWVELMADPELYRVRAWLLFVGGKWSESLYCMEKAMFGARARGPGGKDLAELCRREHSLLVELDSADAARWPVVPQDIFESFWKIGADRCTGGRR